MAEKIMIEIFKKKTMEELSRAVADPDSKLETGSGAAAVASVAGASVAAGALLPPQAESTDRVISTISTSAMVFFIFRFPFSKRFLYFLYLPDTLVIVPLLCKIQNPANVKFKSNAAWHFAAKKPVPNGTGFAFLSTNQ